MKIAHIDPSDYDTDKSEAYLQNYFRHFQNFTDVEALLELGVQRGGSLYMWRDMFPEADIIGLDLNRIELDERRAKNITLYQGFQQDRPLLNAIFADFASRGYDIVVDDASHLGTYTAESFWHIFENHLKSGGVYVLEDWSCAYWPDWTDGSRPRHHPYGQHKTTTGQTSKSVEALRRRVRASARESANTLKKYPFTYRLARTAFGIFDRTTARRRFPSHDFGMVGVVKQIIDAAATGVATRGANTSSISRLEVNESQVFIYKA